MSLRHLTSQSPNELRVPDAVSLAIGVMDGVHLGHQQVLASCVAYAKNAIPTLLTFDPHPSVILRPESEAKRIWPLEDNLDRVARQGIQAVWVHPFDGKFAAMPAQNFVHYLKTHFPKLISVHIGEDFRYGDQRMGDAEMLSEALDGLGIETHVIPDVLWKNKKIGSSRIRKALQLGELDAVSAMLGEHYYTIGTVIQGDQRGRTIGFPTLNVAWGTQLRPLYGVYAVQVRKVDSPLWQPGAANFGLRPTVNDGLEPLLEVHVLEPTPLTYGDLIEVRWIKFIRPEAKFTSLDALQKAIAKDCEKIDLLLK